jgi:hypothetical protein
LQYRPRIVRLPIEEVKRGVSPVLSSDLLDRGYHHYWYRNLCVSHIAFQ